ncbi:uncharacterized protein V1513DRAFT_450862 [Lipomyces chichibuensis]|uniref:uncharacterized protein n=1 Tax=Lipomyces chichibuensis TaxID=1546026 RepID=UPI003342FFEC
MTLADILGNDLSPGTGTNSDLSSPFVASSPISSLSSLRSLESDDAQELLPRVTVTAQICPLRIYVVENILPTNPVSLLDYLCLNNSVYEISTPAYRQFLINVINPKNGCTDCCVHVISSVSHKDVRKGHRLLKALTLWRPDAVVLRIGTMEKKYRDINLDIMMVYGKKVMVVVDTDIKDGTGNIQRYITEKYQVPVTVFGGPEYTDSSGLTVSAIPTSSNTQMKELRDYISWYTRDHLTQTDPKLPLLTSSIRPDSLYNFDGSNVCNVTNLCQLESALFELDIVCVKGHLLCGRCYTLGPIAVNSFHKCKVLELRSHLGTEIGALVEGQSGKAYVGTSSLQLLHNVSRDAIVTLLTEVSLTTAGNPRVDLTVQLDTDVPSAFHEGATVKLYYGAGNTAFALVDKVVSIERLLILKFDPQGVGFLSDKCFAFNSDRVFVVGVDLGVIGPPKEILFRRGTARDAVV